ncbi:hypothetical protein C6I20_08070 [Aeromicrobium sp. A1-2]|nr:hypothetical protein C6I20_08070 [Aeromicrobium sp. A1-2]
MPDRVTVTVEVDPGLRSGWIPPARGSGRAAPGQRTSTPAVGWEAVPDAAAPPAAVQHPSLRSAKVPPAAVRPDATMNFPALVPDLADSAPTMNVASGLRLERDGTPHTIGRSGAVLGRLPESAVPFDEPEVSYRHAAVRAQGVQWQIKDLGSTNGTTVDGHRIDGDAWTTVHPGSVVGLAGVRVIVSLDTAGTVHPQDVSRH